MAERSKKQTKKDDELELDEEGMPILDFSRLQNETVSESLSTSFNIPKWGWWLLLLIDALMIVYTVLVGYHGLIFGVLALVLSLFIERYGKDALLENYERRVQDRYGDRVELSPEQRRELRHAISQAEVLHRQEKKLERAAKREAKRSGRSYDEVLKEMKAEAKAKDAAKVDDAAKDAADDAAQTEDVLHEAAKAAEEIGTPAGKE